MAAVSRAESHQQGFSSLPLKCGFVEKQREGILVLIEMFTIQYQLDISVCFFCLFLLIYFGLF